jgi:hypothetical protein
VLRSIAVRAVNDHVVVNRHVARLKGSVTTGSSVVSPMLTANGARQ